MNIGLMSIVLGSVMMSGCSVAVVRHDDTETTSSLAQLRDQARSVTIHKGDGTGEAAWNEVVAAMASADVVLFGEMHGHPLGLAVAQELWEDILIASPQAVLAMEFYERDQQVALDDYLSGVTDRKAFEKAAGKDKGNNPPGHARMIDASKEAGRPILAANAARRYVKLARIDGYEALEVLGASQQALFNVPIGDGEGAYKDRFMELMGGMGDHADPERAASFFRSQSVWDATMGQSIVDGLELGSPVAHVVGYFHVQFGNEQGGSGLIDSIRARSHRELNIVSIIQLARDDQPLFTGTDEVLGDEGEVTEEADDSDEGISTYVVYVGEHKE